ncbi:MAG: hypothetical protein OXG35_27875 [Acidobacteria bacterium]|nr:hypothetical protein [Acidobacteriota bacterium]
MVRFRSLLSIAALTVASAAKDRRGRARRAVANAPGVPSFEVEVLRSELARYVLLLAVGKGK